MTDSLRATGKHPLLRWEPIAVLLLAWLGFLAIPLSHNTMGLSWDALNHHIYLGWIADRPRFDQDFLAANYQSLTFPYLYWPVYKLATLGAGPMLAGMVLATLHLIAVPPVWMIARTCIPGQEAADVAMRFMAVVLAFLSGLVLSLFDSTSNDLMAAAPMVWAVAFALDAGFRQERRVSRRRLTILSGLSAGIAVACKLSNGPLVVALPLLWLFCGQDAREKIVNTVLAGIAAVVGFALAYGYWGTQLWIHFGNPVYPFYDGAFQPLRAWLGWVP